MEKQISKGLKYLFLVHGILGVIFGLGNLLVPNLLPSMFGAGLPDPEPYRAVGAAILGFTASSWLAYMETAWERVRIVVVAEIVWTILCTLALLWLLFAQGFSVAQLGNAVIMGGFAAAFCYFYFRR